MKYFASILVILVPLCAQASPETIYRSLIEQSLNQQALCLGEKKWPVSIKTGTNIWLNAKMEALVDAGLVTSHVKSGIKIWTLTPYGQSLFRMHHDFCYGTMRVRDIKTINKDDSGITSVFFTYYIKELPSWVKNNSVRVANTDIDNLIMGIDKVYYQAQFSTDSQKIRLIREPEPLELLY